MKELIKINGIKEVNEMRFHEVEGGFGEGKKSILAKDIADIHSRKLFKLNQLINDNRTRFKDNVDIIDLKTYTSEVYVLLDDIFTKAEIGNANNIYLLSERGYSKLLKIMEDDLAWKKYDELVDNYFNMRQVINSDEELKKNLLMSIYKGGAESVVATKQLVELETKPLNKKIEEQKPYVDLVKERIAKGEKISLTDVTESLVLKRGQISNYLKENGYLHKTRTEVNKKGKGMFAIYKEGNFNCIGVLEKGIDFINEHLEEIKQTKARKSKKNK